MAKSSFYDATEEDSRAWAGTEIARAEAKDAAGVNNAAAIQTRTRATNPIDGISVSPSSDTLDLSDEETVQLTVAGTVSGQASSAGFVVTWSSSDEAKATVSDTGLVTPVAVGTATITATCVHDTNVTDTCSITVQA